MSPRRISRDLAQREQQVAAPVEELRFGLRGELGVRLRLSGDSGVGIPAAVKIVSYIEMPNAGRAQASGSG